MSDFLTREDIFSLNDIETKELTVPTHIPGWGGKKIYIRQLTRGEQDAYRKRIYGNTTMKQDTRAKKQEISGFGIMGHDAFLCVMGMCNPDGSRMFKPEDEAKLKERNGEAIGWIALEIVNYSGMADDEKVARGEQSEEEALAEDVKN